MATFDPYTGTGDNTLVNALLAPSSGITVSNIVLKASGQDAVNFYDGSLGALGIGSGLLLTSGTTPGTSNTVGWFGTDNSTTVFNNGDADIDAVVNTVFQTQSYDATTLEFDFTAGATATSVSFDLVFGSDEYPEWVDQFVDCAVVMVNGVNYAYFNHDPLAPLSVVSSNLAAGYFQDNAGNVLPIEYDGVSHVLKIVAPIIAGQTNHIKIGIADTGDHIYDSGIFISNFSAGNIPGSGVVSQTKGTTGDDTLIGSSQAEYFDLQSGNDTVYAGAGDDIVVAGSGNDVVYGGTGADKMEGDAGDDYLDGGADVDTAVFTGNFSDYQVGLAGANTTLTSSAEGTDTLVNVEFVQFKDGLYALNGNVLTDVGTPTPVANSAGVAAISGVAMAGKTLTAITTDADGIASAATISYQWQTSDDGVNWSDTSVTTKTYLLTIADIGKHVQVIASYSDASGNPETPISNAVTIAQATSGFSINPMVISAPAGASVMDPLTTLIKNAVDFGYTPNEASLAVKFVFGISSNVNLATYDAYAILSSNPTDATAVVFMKVAAQVAMTASVSDPSGMNMMLAVMNAAATGKTLNLANAADLVAVGVDPDPTVDPISLKSNLDVIQDLNKKMAEDASDLAGIVLVWDDWAGKTDAVEQEFMGHLEKISVHINQAPTGFSVASLVNGLENTAYVISASDLLQGFQDPEGGLLSVSWLSADSGVVTDNGKGTFTITQLDGFSGPVELTYVVSDDQGATTSASQMFVIEPIQVIPTNHAPALTGSIATLAAGTEDTTYTVNAAALLQGFSDVDGDTPSVSGLVADHGDVIDNGDGTFTVTPTANFNGTVTLSYAVTDGIDSIAANQSFELAAVNDAPIGAASAALVAGTEDITYTISQADLLMGFSDIDGDTLSVSSLSATNGTVAPNLNGSWTITPSANFNGTVTLTYNVTDSKGGNVVGTQSYSLIAVNDAATGSVTITGTATEGQTLTAANTLDDADGLGAISYQWLAGGSTISGATNSSYTLTQAEVGKTVTVTASYVDGGGTYENVTSLTTGAVQALATGVTLTGTATANTLNGGVGDDTLFGLGGNDILNGNAGNDILDGGTGKDKMAGGTGDDTYYVDSTGDTITELTGAWIDKVISMLSAYTLGSNLENLTLAGTSANGTGNTLDNVLLGNGADNILTGLAGNDVLDGGAGNDKLIGGAGNDLLTGGAGIDIFRFDTALNASTNLDTINDFVAIDDTIQLENAIFTKLTKTGTLSSANFIANVNGTAGDANDYIVYNTSTGAVSYDADGSGAGAAVNFATLVGHPAITAADFIVT